MTLKCHLSTTVQKNLFQETPKLIHKLLELIGTRELMRAPKSTHISIDEYWEGNVELIAWP